MQRELLWSGNVKCRHFPASDHHNPVCVRNLCVECCIKYISKIFFSRNINSSQLNLHTGLSEFQSPSAIVLQWCFAFKRLWWKSVEYLYSIDVIYVFLSMYLCLKEIAFYVFPLTFIDGESKQIANIVSGNEGIHSWGQYMFTGESEFCTKVWTSYKKVQKEQKNKIIFHLYKYIYTYMNIYILYTHTLYKYIFLCCFFLLGKLIIISLIVWF